jgi:excisionase family DNA binding protein
MTGVETFLDVGQVAEMLGLSIATIRKWVLTGFIPYKKIGKAVRFSATEIQEWAKSKNGRPARHQAQWGAKESTRDVERVCPKDLSWRAPNECNTNNNLEGGGK